MELEEAGAPVSVTLVKPASINTPFPDHARSYLEQQPKLPSPVYAPEVVAEVILHCAETPERDVYAGGKAKMDAVIGAVAPRLTDRLMEAIYVKKQKSGLPPDHSQEALHAPTTGLRERGPHTGHTRESSLYTRASLHPILTGAVALGAGLAIASVVGGTLGKKNG